VTATEIHQQLVDRFGSETIVALSTDRVDPSIEVRAGEIAQVADYLKLDPSLAFDQLCDLTAVDYFEADPKKQKSFAHEPHLEVVYQLFSVTHKHRIAIKAKLPRWANDVPGELPEIDTVSHVWAIADWHEREAFDLLGVRFAGHPNLVRILCPDDWVGHALRKDYEFPLEYHGVRGK
jgi:NADH-quinone oxidoreductase subunit C